MMKDEPHGFDLTPAAARPRKRSLAIAGHRTSISLEDAFWDALKELAAGEEKALAALVAEVDAKRGAAGLSSALRVYVLNIYRQRAGYDLDG